MPNSFRGSAIQVVQPIGEFWAAAIPASVLLDSTLPDPLRAVSDPQHLKGTNEWRSAVRMLGNQRPLVTRRLEKIAEYIDGIEATFPNSIILATSSERMEGGKEPWTVQQDAGGHWSLSIPADPERASIVDGQHRLYGFLRSKVEGRQQFSLLCAVFFDMPMEIQAYVFATINGNQTQVSRGLALNLYGYNVEDEKQAYWSPEKLSVFIARRLNFDPESALVNRIKIEAEDAPIAEKLPGATRAVPLAAIVDGVLGLISDDFKRDRDALRSLRFSIRKTRKRLDDDTGVLRKWYKASADASLYLAVREYLREVDGIFWGSPKAGSMLTRAVGIRALLQLLREWLRHEDIPDGSKADQFIKTLMSKIRTSLLRAQHVDFADSFFEASGRGQKRILNQLMVSTGLLKIDSLPAEDVDEYRRISTGAGR